MVSAAIWRMITNRRSEPINFCAFYIQIADLNGQSLFIYLL